MKINPMQQLPVLTALCAPGLQNGVSLSTTSPDGVKKLISILTLAAAGFLCASQANAQDITINAKLVSQYGYTPDTTYAPGTDPLFPTAVDRSAYYAGVGAAPDTGTFWNGAVHQFAALTDPPFSVSTTGDLRSFTDMRASDGVPQTGVNFEVGGGGGFVDFSSDSSRTDVHNLMGTFMNANGNLGQGEFFITGLQPNVNYQLYLYGGSTTYSVAGGTADNGLVSAVNNSQTSGNNGAIGAEGGNWVMFTGSTGASGDISGTFTKYGGSGGDFAGLQIVEQVVPEPTTLALVGMCGPALLLFRRHRK